MRVIETNFARVISSSSLKMNSFLLDGFRVHRGHLWAASSWGRRPHATNTHTYTKRSARRRIASCGIRPLEHRLTWRHNYVLPTLDTEGRWLSALQKSRIQQLARRRNSLELSKVQPASKDVVKAWVEKVEVVTMQNNFSIYYFSCINN